MAATQQPYAGRSGPTIALLDRVRLRSTFKIDDTIFPAGSLGTVVHVYSDGTACEVEFVRPLPAVLTLRSVQIEKTPA